MRGIVIEESPWRRPPGAFGSFKIAWTALDSFAFFAFGNILYFAILENCLHLDLAAARAIEAMGRASSTSVFRNLCHDNSFCSSKQPQQEYRNWS